MEHRGPKEGWCLWLMEGRGVRGLFVEAPECSFLPEK